MKSKITCYFNVLMKRTAVLMPVLHVYFAHLMSASGNPPSSTTSDPCGSPASSNGAGSLSASISARHSQKLALGRHPVLFTNSVGSHCDVIDDVTRHKLCHKHG